VTATQELLKRFPNIVEVGGNAAELAERSLLDAMAGTDFFSRGLYRTKLAALRAELAGPQPSRLERLLVERVVACWLQVYHADAIAAQAGSITLAEGDYNQRRQDRAHRRLMSAVKTLATVRRLALPTLVAVSVTGTLETKEAEPAPMLAKERLAVNHRDEMPPIGAAELEAERKLIDLGKQSGIIE
jgi:hypothetical protein